MTVRLAAIGFQHQHIFHLVDRFVAQPGVELVALAEHDETLRARAIERYPATSYDDYRDLLAHERVDLAVLAPMTSDKSTAIAACAAAGVHVCVDKPMAASMAENERIAEAARQHHTIVYMAANGGYGQTASWKRVIDSGALGRLVHFVNLAPHRLKLRPEAGWTRPAWSYQREHNGSVLVDLAIHGVNTWRYLSGQEVAEVTASHANKRFPEYPGLEDHGSVLLTMTDGSTAFLGPSWLTPTAEPSHGRGCTYVVGTEGQLEVTSVGVAHGLTGSVDSYQTVLTTASQGPHAPALESDGLSPEADILAAIAERRQPRISSAFAVESMRVALMARAAADAKRTIRLR